LGIDKTCETCETCETYETYEMQLVRELEQQRVVLQNELLLLYRTRENIALWNLGAIGDFSRYVLVVGFRYDVASPARTLKAMRYAYDGTGPKLLLSSYVCSHAEVELHELERGLPREKIPDEPLEVEMANVQRELRRLDRMQRALYSYAPGGTAYRRLVRKAAQVGMTRYHLRAVTKRPKRFL
jgi:hypothetical protein